MSVVIKTNAMKYKDSNGDYQGFNAIAQESTAQQLADIANAGQDQVTAIQQKGAETYASIPDDYTELSDDVTDLKSALNSITKYGKNLFNEEYVSGKRLSAATGLETDSSAAHAGEEFIPVKANTAYTVSISGYTIPVSDKLFVVCEYDSSKSPVNLPGENNTTGEAITITTGSTTAYIRISCTIYAKDVMVEEGTTATSYEPFNGFYVDPDKVDSYTKAQTYTKTESDALFTEDDKTLTVSGKAADAKVTGELAQKPSPFVPVLFAPSRIEGNNYGLYDGSTSHTDSRVDSRNVLGIPSYTAASGIRAFSILADTPWHIDADDVDKIRYGILIKLKTEDVSTSFTFYHSTGITWGSNPKAVADLTFTKSGYYTFVCTVNHTSEETNKILKWFIINGNAENVDSLMIFEGGIDNYCDKNSVYEKADVYNKTEVNDLIAAITPAAPTADIIFWGDSLTYGVGGGTGNNRVTFPKVCCEILSKTGLNCGVGGETANTIAARQGGNNVVLPAGAVNTTFTNAQFLDIYGTPIAPLRQATGADSGNALYIDGQLCSLAITQESTTSSTYSYTISGYTGNNFDYPIIGTFRGETYNGDITVIFVGTNGCQIGADRTIAARMKIIDSMIAKIANKKYLVMGVWYIGGYSGAPGTLDDTSGASDETAMLDHYGNKFFNTRAMMSKYGIETAGLTPTADDTAAKVAGTIPPSLLNDTVHLNANGYEALGKMVANKIKSLGYV